MLIEYNILNKKISLIINQQSEFTNNITLTINDTIIYGVIVINNTNNSNTNLTVFYKESPYYSGVLNNKKINKTDKEIRISRQIDRSLRPFLSLINKEININIILMQNLTNKDVIEEILLTGFILTHISGFVKKNLYTENIYINEKGKKNINMLSVFNDDGIVMIEGYFNKILKEDILNHINNIYNNQKEFTKFYEYLNTKINNNYNLDFEYKNISIEKSFNKTRMDGRKFLEIRPINIILNPLKMNSCIFQRGQTKVLVVSNIQENEYNDFTLQYKFHPFSVDGMGETFGNSRREKGHSFLGQNSIKPLTHKGLSYDIISEVLVCNGSSSMATVCGASICLNLFSGEELVSGITTGIIGKNICLDLIGDEDQISKCDLKIVNNKNNEIFSIFMDTKEIVTLSQLEKLITTGLKGNNHILKIMENSLKDKLQISFFLKKEKIIYFNYKDNISTLENIFNVKIITYKNGLVIIYYSNTLSKKDLSHLINIVKSYDSLMHDKQITCVIGNIKENNDKKYIHLGCFTYILNLDEKFKYITGDIIAGIIDNNNNQSKMIVLKNIKKVKLNIKK